MNECVDACEWFAKHANVVLKQYLNVSNADMKCINENMSYEIKR